MPNIKISSKVEESAWQSLKFLAAEQNRNISSVLTEAGVRDYGLLLSALYRPQTRYSADLAQMGAALFESLIVTHPFFDGNKRVSFFGTDVFFRLNGFRFEVDANEAHSFLIELIESER